MRLLSRQDLKSLKGIDYSASQLWRLMRLGKFPKQVKIGDKNLWPEHEIDRFIKSLIAKRNQKAA
jgi:predicted DNA-binding transcriptional regulator AlpA